MGIAEFVQEINKNVKEVKYEVRLIQSDSSKNNVVAQPPRFQRWLSVDEILKREELAQKIEKLFNNENATKVDAIKQEMTTVVETNFLRMLAAILITGPVQAQEKTPEIFRVSASTKHLFISRITIFKLTLIPYSFLLAHAKRIERKNGLQTNC